MKRFYLLALIFVLFISFSFAETSLNQAINWMNNNWLTRFTNSTSFMATKNLRRDEATKFFVQYATEILWLTPDTSKKSCNFSDLSNARPDLKDPIKKSCQLGLFQWTNGRFMPTQSLTNAQAITVLIRMIDGKKDETQWHFAQKYFEKAQELWIMDWLKLNSTANFDKLTTRWDVWILLYNASNLTNTETDTTPALAKDYCPNGDTSTSYYDHTCGWETNTNDTIPTLVKDYCPSGDNSPSYYDKTCGWWLNTVDTVSNSEESATDLSSLDLLRNQKWEIELSIPKKEYNDYGLVFNIQRDGEKFNVITKQKNAITWKLSYYGSYSAWFAYKQTSFSTWDYNTPYLQIEDCYYLYPNIKVDFRCDMYYINWVIEGNSVSWRDYYLGWAGYDYIDELYATYSVIIKSKSTKEVSDCAYKGGTYFWDKIYHSKWTKKWEELTEFICFDTEEDANNAWYTASLLNP